MLYSWSRSALSEAFRQLQRDDLDVFVSAASHAIRELHHLRAANRYRAVDVWFAVRLPAEYRAQGRPFEAPNRSVVGTYVERCAARRRDLEIALDRFLSVCRNRPDVLAVYAFGSFALAQTGPRSDLDLLVVRETTVRGIERGADLAIEADLGVALDLIVVTPAEYRERLPATSFGRTILASARAVYAA